MPAELQDDELLEDDDDSSESEEVERDQEDDEDALSLVEESDNEDLISLDADIPDGLIDFDETMPNDEHEEWGGIEGVASKKRKRGSDRDQKERKKKLRSLPTFASYEDYAKMIEDSPEDNI
jgi:ribosome biogenesis protein MAK21